MPSTHVMTIKLREKSWRFCSNFIWAKDLHHVLTAMTQYFYLLWYVVIIILMFVHKHLTLAGFVVSQDKLFNEHLVSASGNPALVMRRKKHTEKEVHAHLISVVSVRLREGYTIRDISLTKGKNISDQLLWRLNCFTSSSGGFISNYTLKHVTKMIDRMVSDLFDLNDMLWLFQQ